MKATKNIHFIFSMISLVVIFFSFSTVSFADENTNHFSVSPLNPETNEVQSSYYDFNVTPEENKKIAIRVFNSSNQEMDFNIELNDATTNDNGITSYLAEDERDSTLKLGFSDIAKIKESTVTIPANSSEDVPINITVPKEPFEGVILGGIRVTNSENKDSKEEKKAGVTSKVAYTVGVVMRESETVIKPEIKLNGVSADQRDYRNYISANLQNIKPTMVKSLEVKAEVYSKNNKLMYRTDRDGMRMAPNSNFNFGISLEDQKLIPGMYTLKLSGEADGVPFSFEQKFEITKKEANKYNKNAVFVADNTSINVVWYFVAGIILAATIIVLFIRKRRREKNEK